MAVVKKTTRKSISPKTKQLKSKQKRAVVSKVAEKKNAKAVLVRRTKTAKPALKKHWKHEKYGAVDRRINSFFALIFVLVLGLLVGTLVYLSNKKDVKLASQLNTQLPAASKTYNNDVNVEIKSSETNKKDCVSRTFEGEETVHGWFVPDQDGNGVLVHIVKNDLAKLPLTNSLSDERKENFVLKLIDAPTQLVTKLKKASQQNPQEFTIKGYVDKCDDVHLSSIEPATKAFRKI